MTERRVNVRAVIFKDGKLFAQQLTHDHGGNSFWCTAGGGLDPGESLREGLTREMIEETGITPVIGRLLFVQQFHDGAREQLEFFFHVENVDDYEVIDLSKTTHGMLEVERCYFIDPKTENILPSFLQTIDVQSYIDGTLPVLIDNELPTLSRN